MYAKRGKRVENNLVLSAYNSFSWLIAISFKKAEREEMHKVPVQLNP